MASFKYLKLIHRLARLADTGQSNSISFHLGTTPRPMWSTVFQWLIGKSSRCNNIRKDSFQPNHPETATRFSRFLFCRQTSYSGREGLVACSQTSPQRERSRGIYMKCQNLAVPTPLFKVCPCRSHLLKLLELDKRRLKREIVEPEIQNPNVRQCSP